MFPVRKQRSLAKFQDLKYYGFVKIFHNLLTNYPQLQVPLHSNLISSFLKLKSSYETKNNDIFRPETHKLSSTTLIAHVRKKTELAELHHGYLGLEGVSIVLSI